MHCMYGHYPMLQSHGVATEDCIDVLRACFDDMYQYYFYLIIHQVMPNKKELMDWMQQR